MNSQLKKTNEEIENLHEETDRKLRDTDIRTGEIAEDMKNESKIKKHAREKEKDELSEETRKIEEISSQLQKVEKEKIELIKDIATLNARYDQLQKDFCAERNENHVLKSNNKELNEHKKRERERFNNRRHRRH